MSVNLYDNFLLQGENFQTATELAEVLLEQNCSPLSPIDPASQSTACDNTDFDPHDESHENQTVKSLGAEEVDEMAKLEAAAAKPEDEECKETKPPGPGKLLFHYYSSL